MAFYKIAHNNHNPNNLTPKSQLLKIYASFCALYTNINPYSIIPEISPKTRPTGTILTEKGYDEVYIKFKKNWYIQYSNMKNYLNNEGWGYYVKYYKWK